MILDHTTTRDLSNRRGEDIFCVQEIETKNTQIHAPSATMESAGSTASKKLFEKAVKTEKGKNKNFL